jgi:hypothetical protein
MYLVHTGWQTKTPVYKRTPGGSGGGESGEAAAFRLVQTLDSKGPHDAVRRSSKLIHIIHAHLVLTSCSRRAHAYVCIRHAGRLDDARASLPLPIRGSGS